MTPSSGKQLLYALRKVLRPLVRILIRAGIRFDEFAEVARGVYVESAIRDGLDSANNNLTRTRISVATGVPRQQVDYYVDNDGALPSASPTFASTLVEVLQKWHTDPAYVGPYGIPLELEFETPSGRSFRSLVALVDPNVSAGVALEELLRVGSVTYSGEKHFRALSRFFVMPEPMSPTQIENFGRTLTRLARTLEFNMNPQNSDKRLERFVVADRGLPPEVVPRFEQYARERTVEFLLDLDDWLTPYSAAEVTDPGPRVPVGLNVFLHLDPPAEEAPLRDLVQSHEDVTKR